MPLLIKISNSNGCIWFERMINNDDLQIVFVLLTTIGQIAERIWKKIKLIFLS